jgi:hypothetical protein
LSSGRPEGSPPVSLETASKIAAASVVAAYVVGLLTVSTYLHRNGVVLDDPTAFRGRFIYTGASVLGVILLSTVAVSFALTLWGYAAVGEQVAPDLYGDGERPHRRMWAVAVALLPVGLLVVLLRAGGEVSWSDSALYWDSLALCASGAVGGLAALMGLIAAFGVRTRLRRWLIAIGLAFYGASFLMLMIVFASEALYSRIPQQFGGGAAEPIQLHFAPGARQAALQLGVPLVGDTNMSADLRVLFTSSHYTIVQLPNKKIVQLKESLIDGAR